MCKRGLYKPTTGRCLGSLPTPMHVSPELGGNVEAGLPCAQPRLGLNRAWGKLSQIIKVPCDTADRSQYHTSSFKAYAHSKGMHIALLCAQGPGLGLHINLRYHCCRKASSDCITDLCWIFKGMVLNSS